MIARTWRGTAGSGEHGVAYERHFTRNVVPQLEALPGHRGAYLLRREHDGKVEFLAMTLWDSIDSIRAFAGASPNVAMVDPEARAVLTEFDEFVAHYDIAHSPR